ncbi:MAG: hypothetical protein ACRDJO_10560 [Actinomycetota bacterium]
MPDERGGDAEFTTSQRAGLQSRRADQDRTLEAMQRLEAALESAAPGREGRWRDEVTAALRILDEATTEEAENANRPDSLLSDIALTQPRLRTRVRGVRTQYRSLGDTLRSLRQELEGPDDAAPDFADIRQRLAWLLGALRHQRARESDLIYEAFYEAYRSELGDADPRGGGTAPAG